MQQKCTSEETREKGYAPLSEARGLGAIESVIVDGGLGYGWLAYESTSLVVDTKERKKGGSGGICGAGPFDVIG